MITMALHRPTIQEFGTRLGVQQGFGDLPAIELWNLTRSIPGHPVGSTVARQTIEKHLARTGGAPFHPGAKPADDSHR